MNAGSAVMNDQPSFACTGQHKYTTDFMSSVADGPRELLVYSRLHESNQVLVGVQDFGVGIEPENLKKIFDPFYTTKSQGMGMGLANQSLHC